MIKDKPLSERAYITKQYAQRTVQNETRRTTACIAGTPYKRCRTLWFAPQTGHWHWGVSLYSSLRLLPIYVSSLREHGVIYLFISLSLYLFIFLSLYLFITNH